MNLLAPVSTIMTKDNLITLQPEDSLTAVNDVFEQHQIHHIPIIKQDQLVGMVSKTDFLHFHLGFTRGKLTEEWNKARMEEHTVEDIMTTNLGKVEPSDRINVVIEVFKYNYFHALPVVDQGKLVGIVTTHDIICHLAEDEQVTKEYNS